MGREVRLSPGGQEAGTWEPYERRRTHLQQHRQQEAQVHLVDAHLAHRLERLLHLHGRPRARPRPSRQREPGPDPPSRRPRSGAALPGRPGARAPRRPAPARPRQRRAGRGVAARAGRREVRLRGRGRRPGARAGLRVRGGMPGTRAAGLPVKDFFLRGMGFCAA